MKYCGKIKAEIIDDLHSLDPSDFYDMYFKTDEVWYFNNQLPNKKSPEEYLQIVSAIISDHFEISKDSYLIVGSAKIGFSLSPKKNFRGFGVPSRNFGQSDLDIAIISDSLFNELWEAFKDLTYRTFVNNYPIISSSIFKGYLNDKYIYNQLTLESDLKEKMDKCNISMQDDIGILEPVNYRFYSSWEDLEKYTKSGINKCKDEGEKIGIQI
ncbi:hypothetical protein ABZZ32_000845 [Listeria monocytogenes]|uniref:hypothetical protein n=1 Tax=Listeria monocytogenes TaxID=1639 RepID=UPI0011EB9F41|nr:hypothetical protein [Listeria monocytogenes]TYT98958.1 hypothetical protein FZ034_04495 [Listeria monocytogenes]